MKAKTLNVFIRADASLQIGTGHVMRCMTLANELRQRGVAVSFVSRELPGHLCDFVEEAGFAVCRLPRSAAPSMATVGMPAHAGWLEATFGQDAIETELAVTASNSSIDWLVVDHYALDRQWERSMRRFAGGIMVIDDLADRRHECDLLLDQNLYADMKTRYNGLVPPNTVKLLGPEFALLHDDFRAGRLNIRTRTGVIERVLVSFGGCDLSNQTTKAIEAIVSSKRSVSGVDIVIGCNNPNRKAIEEAASQLPAAKCHFNARNMANLMIEADMCIGAAGGTTWERCCLGVPSMVVTVADNQVETIRCMHEKKILYFVGEHSKVSIKDLAEAFDMFCDDSGLMTQFSERSMSLVDGMGVQKCVDGMLFVGQDEKRGGKRRQ